MEVTFSQMQFRIWGFVSASVKNIREAEITSFRHLTDTPGSCCFCLALPSRTSGFLGFWLLPWFVVTALPQPLVLAI